MKMARRQWVVIGIVALVAALAAGSYFYRNGAMRSAVERHLNASLDVGCGVDGARVQLLGGDVSLLGVELASPKDHKAARMLRIERVDAQVGLGQHSGDPVRVDALTITGARLYVEYKGMLNFQRIATAAPKSPAVDKPGDGERQEGEPMRLLVAKALVNDAAVVLRPGLPGVGREEMVVPVPSFEMARLGAGKGNKEGATLKDLAAQLMVALAAKALDVSRSTDEKRVPHDAKTLIGQGVTTAGLFIGGEFANEVQALSKALGGLTKDVAPPTAKPDIDKGLPDIDLDGRP
jgi:hypothetical protein